MIDREFAFRQFRHRVWAAAHDLCEYLQVPVEPHELEYVVADAVVALPVCESEDDA